MRVLEILYEMTSQEAADIFRKHGVEPSGDLSNARRALLFKNHPDRGGDVEVAKAINQAYDILSGKTAPDRVSPSYSRPTGGNYGGGGYSSYSSAGGAGFGAGFSGFDRRKRRNPHQEREDLKSRHPNVPPWAWAGYSGGIPDSGQIYRNNYTDVNFIKKRMWELSGKSNKEYTLHGFDRRYFRGITTVYGSPKIFNEMAKAMYDWQTKGGNPYECRAVFVSPGKKKDLFLIYADGKFYGDNPIPLAHDSFNRNPGNDQRFMDSIPGFLDQLKAQSGQ